MLSVVDHGSDAMMSLKGQHTSDVEHGSTHDVCDGSTVCTLCPTDV